MGGSDGRADEEEGDGAMVHLWDGRRPGERLVPGPGELRERWRCRSAETGWALTGDWWTPAVESVVSAACGEPGLAAACKRLGEARGRAGVGIGETLEDLGALFAELNWPDPPLSLVRCAAEGWADGGAPEPPDATCEDPLTGLMTASYLRSRLTELYREAGGAPDGHVLLFVDLPAGDEPWRRLSRSLVVAHELREVFRRGETVAFTGPSRAAALVPAGRRAEADAVVLRHLLEQALGESDEAELFHSLFGTNGFGVRLVPLPEDLRSALALLEPSAS